MDFYLNTFVPFALIMGAILGVWWVITSIKPPEAAKRAEPKWTPATILLTLAVLLILALSLPVFVLFVDEAFINNDRADHTDLRNLALILAGVFGAGFAAWRATVAQKQATTAELSFANTKLNDAFKDLAARRIETFEARNIKYKLEERTFNVLETRECTPDIPEGAKDITEEPWQILSRNIPDIVTRSAAIDRLGGLAEEQPDSRERIVAALCLYVRETSNEEAKPVSLPLSLLNPVHKTSESAEDPFLNWIDALPKARTDRQSAVQTVAKLNAISQVKINLTNANLQAMELSGCNFNNAYFNEAKMHGIQLSFAEMNKAVLLGAEMQGANLVAAEMRNTVLMEALMVRANLSMTDMHGAECKNARMHQAILIDAKMNKANFSEGGLQGTILFHAEMQGAVFNQTHMSKDTDLRPATLRGAGLRSVDATTIAKFEPFFDQIFADGTILPDDPNRPAHWATEELDYDDFYEAWRAWQTTLDPPLDID